MQRTGYVLFRALVGNLGSLTLGAHAHEGYSTLFVCLFACLSVCLSVTSLLVSMTILTYLPVLR